MRRVLVMSSSGFASRTMKSARAPRRQPTGVRESETVRRAAGGGDERVHRAQAGRPPSAPARGAPRSRRSDPARRSPSRGPASPRPRGASPDCAPGARTTARPPPRRPRCGGVNAPVARASTSGATVSARIGAVSHGGGLGVPAPLRDADVRHDEDVLFDDGRDQRVVHLAVADQVCEAVDAGRDQLLRVGVVEDVGDHVEPRAGAPRR